MNSETEGGTENINMDQIRIRRVPANLMEFLRSRIVQYVERMDNLSAEIHEMPGQPAKLVLHGGEYEVSLPQDESVVTVEDATVKTNKILIKNIPIADEELLEGFFEHRKKGGAVVESVQVNKQKNWAIIEFCENEAVERVMSKTPIKMMDTELDICPYIPLLQGNGVIENLEFRTIPKELTEELLTMHVEGTSILSDISSAEYKSDEDDTGKTEQTMQQMSASSSDNEEIITRQTIRILKPVQLMMLQSINYVDTVSEKFPTIKLDIDLEKNEIGYDKDDDGIHPFLLNLIETLNGLATHSSDDMSLDAIELYTREGVVEYINNQLKSENLICAWAVTSTGIEVCSAKADIKRCTSAVRGSVTEAQFPICKVSSATFLTPQWQEELHKIQQEYNTLCKVCFDKDEIKVSVITTDIVVDKVVNRIKEFLKSQLKITTEVLNDFEKNFYWFGKVYNAYSPLACKVVDQISKDLFIHHVRFELNSNGTHKLSGTPEGRELAKGKLQRLDVW